MEPQRIPSQPTPEQLRDSLRDLVVLARGLSSVCQTVGEMVEVCDLAMTNEAQLTMILMVTRTSQQAQQQPRR